MAITYPHDPPGTPGYRAATFRLTSPVAEVRSVFTGHGQFYQHSSGWWEAELTLPPMARATAAAWVAWLAALDGKAGTFRLGDPAAKTPRGTAAGGPLVDGSGQVGQTLLTKGWTPSAPGVLLRGDYVEVGGQLLKVVEDASADGTGKAALTVRPGLRTPSVDGGIVTTTNARGLFRLASNERAWDLDVVRTYGITFAAREDF